MPTSIHTRVDRSFEFVQENKDISVAIVCWKSGDFGFRLTERTYDPQSEITQAFEHTGLTRQDLEHLRTAINRALTYKEEDNEPL
jgi:hypothetical protein